MASPLPQPTAPLPSTPLRPPSTVPLPTHFTSPAVANSFRLTKVAERFALHFKGGAGAGALFDTSDFFHLCFALARGIDYALTINDVPEIVHHLPSIIKQVYQRKHETSLQSAIMVLLISAKNACKFGWFNSSDADEILNMTNELCSSFCMTVCVTIEVENSLDIISKIMPRFYPQLTFCSLIVSFEAKPGYEILMADFQIPRNMPPEQKIRLIVVQTDNLETSSCIINPPHVSFMVNGKGVEKRTNVSLDSGPQFPTDITKMLKYGTNLIQAIGYFSGTYLIALAFMSKITSSSTPVLKDYVQPAVAELDSDSEIVVGPSRITLNCPISFRRIRTPVKGHLCKHHQCFDYDNFMEMNSRKPSWRCPCCNQCVSCIDLRIDRNMVKILEEVGEDVVDIVISADGSWKAVVEHHESTGQPHNGTLEGQQDSNMGCESSKFGNTPPDAVDLTMVEDDQRDTAICRSDCHDVETEERKPPIYSSIATQWPFFQIGNDISPRISSTSSLNGSLNHTGPDVHPVGTLDSFFPGVLVNPVVTDAISPAPNREPMASLGTSQPSFSFQHLLQTGQHTENMQLQQHSQFGNPVINSGTERASIPRLVSRTPIAVQALPAQPQAVSSSQRIRTNPLTLSSMIPSGYSSTTYTTSHGMAANSGLYALSGDRDMQQILRTSEISMTQDRDNQDPHHASYSSSQPVVGLPAPNLISTRLPSSQLRGAGAYRSPLQPPANFQNPNRDLSNLRKHPTTQNLPVTFRSSSGFSSSSIGNDSAAQRAAAAARLLAGSVGPQVSRTAPSNTPTSDSVRLSSNEQLRSMPEVPLEQNWRPTGRMRGSLTGSAYSAALSHYLVPPTQPVPSRPPAPTVVSSTSEQLSALITNSINAHNPATQQGNSRQDDGGSLSRGGSII